MKLAWMSVAIMFTCVYAEACQDGQERFGGSCYQLLNGTMTWDQGDTACSDMGAALAVPDSSEEHQFIWEMFTAKVTDGDLWTGCNDREEEGSWVKSGEGGECNFFDWVPGEPRVGDCIQLWRYAGAWSGHMDDTACNNLVYVICESPIQFATPTPLAVHPTSPAVPTLSCLQRYADARSPSHCLTGHVIKEFTVKGVIACGFACRSESGCSSFNLRRAGLGEMICHLSNITRNEADEKNIQLDNDCRYFNF